MELARPVVGRNNQIVCTNTNVQNPFIPIAVLPARHLLPRGLVVDGSVWLLDGGDAPAARDVRSYRMNCAVDDHKRSTYLHTCIVSSKEARSE